MVYKPKELPEDINVTPINPLVNLAHLLATVVIASAIVYVSLGAIATRLAVRISPKLETKIGKQLLSSVPTEPQFDPQQRQYLQSLLDSLSTNSDVPVTIHLQKSEYPNAMIIPGGHIIVTTALLEEARSENELAFVLAHEIGHHVARDPLKALGRSLVFITVASAIGIGSGNADLVTFTGSMSDLHYSRKQELTADFYALSAMIRIYGHGEGSLDFFERLLTKHKYSENKLSEYFSTHPLTQARIDRLEQIAEQRGWRMTGDTTDLPSFDCCL